MDRLNGFCQEVKALVSLKPELFEDAPDRSYLLDQMEKKHNIAFPKEFRCFYQIIGKRNFKKYGYVKLLDIEEFQIGHDEKQGNYLIFAKSRKEDYALFFKSNIVLKEKGDFSWHPVYHNEDNQQSLTKFLLIHLSLSITQVFQNAVSVKLKYSQAKVIETMIAADGKKEVIRDYPEYICESFGLTKSIADECVEESALYDTERKLFAYFDYYSGNKLMIFCDDHDELFNAVGNYPFIWRKQNGKKILNPSKFVKGEPPKSFEEKLDMIRSIIPWARKVKYKEINHELPYYLNYFFSCFSKTENFWNTNMEIVLPEKLDMGKEYIDFAYENQGVFSCAFKKETDEAYISYDQKKYIRIEENLDELLVTIACIQAIMGNLMEVTCEISLSELEDMKPFFFEICHTNNWRCFANPTRKILIFSDKDNVYIGGRTQWYMETLAEDSGVDFSFL